MNNNIHPKLNDDGNPVIIKTPNVATDNGSWHEISNVVTVIPGGQFPAEFEGTAFARWEAAPTTDMGWTEFASQGMTFDEPPLGSFIDAVGALIVEPDGRVWAHSPTNQFAGYTTTYPKGRLTPALSARAAAVKHGYEKTGLRVELTGFAGDFQRTASVTRFYWAKRTGGSPADMGWQSQAVHLLSPFDVDSVITHATDKKLNGLVLDREHTRRHTHMITVLYTLSELIQKGYGRLRVLPYMSSSGCYWRCEFHLLRNPGKVAFRYTNGSEDRYLNAYGDPKRYADISPLELAERIVKTACGKEKEYLQSSSGPLTKAYESWLGELYDQTMRTNRIPVAFSPMSEHDGMWAMDAFLPLGDSGFISQPPDYAAPGSNDVEWPDDHELLVFDDSHPKKIVKIDALIAIDEGEESVPSYEAIVQSVSRFRLLFGHWPEKLLLSKEQMRWFREDVLSPSAYRALKRKLTPVGVASGSDASVADSYGNRLACAVDPQHRTPVAEMWLWGTWSESSRHEWREFVLDFFGVARRLCFALSRFASLYSHWPSTLRIDADTLSSLRAQISPEAFALLTAKLRLVVVAEHTLVVTDNSGRVFDYNSPSGGDNDYELGIEYATRWLWGVTPLV
ncbi:MULTISPECIES: NUDIX hydrolase [Paraburkholderia]|uniref:NUDIX hydrolase n=1 Tax=Paraburkholderia TaxID=1822464 RepID=UPI000377F51B|nr:MULTISPECIES: NUDIX hydrolase [Paraburkholderia]MDH6149326.1 hypothetical protein [Paraburkholderia sp. WSM4179]